MKASEFTESKYMNAKTAGQYNGVTLTIFDVKAEMVGTDEDRTRKMVIGFEGVEKGCIINHTNNKTLQEAFGDETNDWTGKKVILHLVNQQFKGKKVLGIQFEPLTGSISDMAGQIQQAQEDAAAQDTTTSPPLGSAEQHSKSTNGSGKKKR